MGLTPGERDFVRAASFVLRDPLTICRGHLELLSDDPEERRRTLALVLSELDRAGRIVDDLELLAEAERPDFLSPEPIDLDAFTGALAYEASRLAPRTWTIDHAADALLVADRHRLTEAVMNLVQNAAQHTREGDTIGIGTAVVGDEVRVWVRDTGGGVEVSDRHRIFEPFERGRDSHRSYRGGGLGLTIVRAIAEAHGGHVELECRPGGGAMFTIVLHSQAERSVGGGLRSVDKSSFIVH